jgi:N-acylglucosamine 2-epimerase
LKHYQKLYRSELFNEVIPWWQKYSPDAKNGGYFTCITDAGKIFDTDKFIWLQARQIWMFSKLYIEIEPNAAWLNMAQSGIDF